MMNKALPLAACCLRWLAWAFQYLIIWPAAWLMLLIVLLFRLDNTTPGKVLAQEIASVTRDVGSGEYRLFLCGDEPFAPFNPVLAKDKSTAGSAPVAPSAICQKQESIVTDADGYAAHIDGALSPFKQLWIVMACVFAGLAWFLGIRPYFPRYVFVKVASDKGYIRCASSRPERGMGTPAIFPMKKQSEKYKGCDVYASPVSCVSYDKNAKFPKKEDDRE